MLAIRNLSDSPLPQTVFGRPIYCALVLNGPEARAVYTTEVVFLVSVIWGF